MRSLDRSNKERITLKNIIELFLDEKVSIVWFEVSI